MVIVKYIYKTKARTNYQFSMTCYFAKTKFITLNLIKNIKNVWVLYVSCRLDSFDLQHSGSSLGSLLLLILILPFRK